MIRTATMSNFSHAKGTPQIHREFGEKVGKVGTYVLLYSGGVVLLHQAHPGLDQSPEYHPELVGVLSSHVSVIRGPKPLQPCKSRTSV
jgi:hypothetical protein